MKQQIQIYQDPNGNAQIEVQFEQETVWLTQAQMVKLFESSKANISEHISHIFQVGELDPKSTVRNFRTVRQEGKRKVNRELMHYNLDMIISVGYRVNSIRGVQFRKWATSRLKELLVQGYTLNEKRLAQKEQEVYHIKSGIQILARAIEDNAQEKGMSWLQVYAKGLELLDDYDHEQLDAKGKTLRQTIYPSWRDYQALIEDMRKAFDSDVFGKEKGFSDNFYGMCYRREKPVKKSKILRETRPP